MASDNRQIIARRDLDYFFEDLIVRGLVDLDRGRHGEFVVSKNKGSSIMASRITAKSPAAAKGKVIVTPPRRTPAPPKDMAKVIKAKPVAPGGPANRQRLRREGK